MVGYYFVVCATIMPWACLTRKVSVVAQRDHRWFNWLLLFSPCRCHITSKHWRDEAYRSIPAWLYHVLLIKYVVSLVIGSIKKFLILHKALPFIIWQRLVKGLAYKASVWTWTLEGFLSLWTWWVSELSLFVWTMQCILNFHFSSRNLEF